MFCNAGAKELVLLLLFASCTISAQKFTVENGDTVPYHRKIKIYKDTFSFGQITKYPGDTSFSVPCNTFEKRNGEIINVRSKRCLRQGYWRIKDDTGYVHKGYHTKDGNRTGLWRIYTPEGKLYSEKEYISIVDDTYILKSVVFDKHGQPITISEKSWFAKFYLRNVLPIWLIIGFSMFLRAPVNAAIAQREDGQKPVLWIPFDTSFDDSMRYMIAVLFTFWVSGLSPENKWLGIISNSLSFIAVGGFFGVFIGLGASGELS